MKIVRIALLLLSAGAAACTNENIEEKYRSGISQAIDSTGLLAHFKLDGNFDNEVKKSATSLSCNGEAEFVGGGIDNSPMLRLNGRDNYLVLLLFNNAQADTLSLVFWVKMQADASGETSTFREMNPRPVWVDYGLGAVKVAVDGVSSATRLSIDAVGNTPQQSSADFATFFDLVGFYIEITGSRVTCRQQHSQPQEFFALKETFDEYEPTFPIDVNSDILYIGRASTAPYAGTYMEGVIDNIYVYNRRLTPNEVAMFSQMKP
jgi:hypothetical protein